MSEETCQHLEVTERREWQRFATVFACRGCGKEVVISDRDLVNMHPDYLLTYIEGRIVQAFGAMWTGHFAALHEQESREEQEHARRLAQEYASLDAVHAVAETAPEAARERLRGHMRRFHPDHPLLRDDPH